MEASLGWPGSPEPMTQFKTFCCKNANLVVKLFKSNCVCPHTYFQTNNKNNVLKIIVSVELVLFQVKNTMQFEILNLFLF